MKKTVEYLYIHIPFCIRKCIYCDFFSVPRTPAMSASYLEALRGEMELKRGIAADLNAVYIGGGTPSILSGDEISMLLDSVRSVFSLSPGAEVTLEANPGTVTPEKMRAIRTAGVNRISIGVQSLRGDELRILGRIHSGTDALDAVRAARDAGFDNLSVDLLYGIPGQSLQAWEETLAEALELTPEHISAYELTPEEGTPLMSDLRNGRIALPEEETVQGMYYRAVDLLRERGYVHYEISNFARPGHACRHNLNYWDRGEYLGIGPGAYSFIRGKRTGTVRNVSAYIDGVGKGAVPLAEESGLSDDDAFRETLFLGMRKTEGVDVGLIPAERRPEIDKAVRDFVRHGLVEISGHRLRLTRKGLILSNEVFVKLI